MAPETHEARESLARCTSCAWAGVYAVRPEALTAFSAAPTGPLNRCPGCGAGEVRCAIDPAEEREAIRAHLASARVDARVTVTHDGGLAVIVRGAGRVPAVVALDLAALDRDPRATLDALVRGLTDVTGPRGAPYR